MFCLLMFAPGAVGLTLHLDTDVLSLIDSQDDTSAEQGAVLIFLPGFGEIMQVVLMRLIAI